MCADRPVNGNNRWGDLDLSSLTSDAKGALMLGYRTFFAVAGIDDDHPLVPIVLMQVHKWLTYKRYPVDRVTPGSVVSLAPGIEATLSREDAPDGAESVLFILREETPIGVWTTQLIVHDPRSSGGDPWVWLEVDGPDDRRAAKVPRLARMLLDVLDARDAGMPLDDGAPILRGKSVAELVAALHSQTRRGPVFVAGSDASLAEKPWQKLVASLLSETTGMAAGFVLAPSATAEFNKLMGPTHRVEPGVLRTFNLVVQPGDEIDGERHPRLSTRRIVADNGRRAFRVLGAQARDIALAQPIPGYATALAERLRSQADQDFLTSTRSGSRINDAIREIAEASTGPAEEVRTPDLSTEAPPEEVATAPESTSVAAEAEAYLALGIVLDAVTGSTEVSAENILRLGQIVEDAAAVRSLLSRKDRELSDLRGRIQDLESEQAATRANWDEEQADHAITEADRHALEESLRALQIRMLKAGQADIVYSPLDADEQEPEAPGSFQELLDRIDDLTNIVWTGDRDTAIALDESEVLGQWSSKAWDALQALDDYAAARTKDGFAGVVDDYLRTTPPGRHGFSANRHARNESESVRSHKALAAARTLPVPTAVVPSGAIFMGAHFKIAKHGRISPRLHYFDAVAKDGKVYVGYLGPHLPLPKDN